MELPPTYIEGFQDKEASRMMKYRALGDTGMMVSFVSLGASALGGVFDTVDEDICIKVVHEAIKGGINYIDVAPWYGHGKAETVLGKALKTIPRNAYYLTTKVCRYLPEADKMFDFSYERTIKSVDESLERLGVDYIDIIQVHDMEFAPSLDVVINETLPALKKVQESGKARFIGITGYPLENFRTVIDRSPVKIDSILTYCRYSLNDTALLDYIPYFKERGIGIVNGSPIAMGLLTTRGPPKWHPATEEIRAACAEAAKYCQIAEVDISRLALQFSLSLDSIDTTLFSTAKLENLRKNMAATTETLSEHEKKILDEVLEKYFKPLNNKHWEGIEVSKYWRKMNAVQSKN